MKIVKHVLVQILAKLANQLSSLTKTNVSVNKENTEIIKRNAQHYHNTAQVQKTSQRVNVMLVKAPFP